MSAHICPVGSLTSGPASHTQMQSEGPGSPGLSLGLSGEPLLLPSPCSASGLSAEDPPALMLMWAHYGNKYLIIEGNLIPAAAAAACPGEEPSSF